MPHTHKKILDISKYDLSKIESIEILQSIISSIKDKGKVTINDTTVEVAENIEKLKIKYEILPKGEYSLKFDLIFRNEAITTSSSEIIIS